MARRSGRRAVTGPVLVALLALLASSLGAATAAAAQEPDTGPPGRVTADGAVLWDPLDGRVLWERDGDTPRRMASTTKIMTTLLAVEAGSIDDDVEISAIAAAADATPGAATLQLQPGQRIAMRDLLTALMMRSGNDAAAAVAEHVAGSQDAFVARMNERARELELTDTNFLDTTGLSNSPAHHASPVDLTRLAAHAMRSPVFADLVDDFRADVPGLGPLTSRNLLLDSYRGATGVKTGYTALAGLCLVASATRDGRTLYTAVLGSDNSFADTTALLDHGFDTFAVTSAANVAAGVYRTADGTVDLQIVDAAERTVPVAGTVRVRSMLDPVAPARIAPGTRLGRAELVVDGEVVDTAGIAAAAAPVAGDHISGPASPAGGMGAAVEDTVRAFVRSQPRRTPVQLSG
ncbi:D-alanyl-D-alanine carboxypeptidase family protein [soil metagenome]